jgi:rod shape determining protein RodA
MLLFQQIQNMGMIIGLTPITGITLPFVSAGGSSLLSFVPALAVLFVMSHRIKSKRTY